MPTYPGNTKKEMFGQHPPSFTLEKENSKLDHINTTGHFQKPSETSIIQKLGLPGRNQIKMGQLEQMIDPKNIVGMAVKSTSYKTSAA